MLSKRSIQKASVAFFLNDLIDEAELQSILKAFKQKRILPSRIGNTIGPRVHWMICLSLKPKPSLSLLPQSFHFWQKLLGYPRYSLVAMELQLLDWNACASSSRGLSDLIPRFGRSVPQLTLILSEVTKHVYQNNEHLLRDLNQPWLQPRCREEFANAIHQKGVALDNCWGFVDGTVRPISRPEQNQRVMYNGHKRVHAIKFPSVVSPNGLIANLYGPVGKLVLQFFLI